MTVKNSKETSSQNQNPRVTWEGCSVLLHVNAGDRVLCARLTTGSKIKIGNKNCLLQPLIRCPFGFSFQLEVGDDGPFLSRIFPSSEEREQLIEALFANNAIFEKKTAFSQPLATCLHNLQIEKMAINLQISEPWLREYQMQMSSFGGFVLSGTRITGGDQPQLH